MGTNYYAVRTRPTVEDPVHIGKSSWGWLFLFQSQDNSYHYPPIVWNSYDEVKDWLRKYTVDSNDYVIMDEYDNIVQLDELIDIVDEKQNDPYNLENPNNFREGVRNVDGYRFDDRWFC